MRKLIILLAFASILSVPGQAQRKEYDKKNTIAIGSFTLNDVSLEALRRIKKDHSIAAGMEYMYFHVDDSPSVIQHSILGSVGIFTDDVILLCKTGIAKEDRQAFRWDYGAELLLTWNEGKLMPCYGISYTRHTQIQFKVGVVF